MNNNNFWRNFWLLVLVALITVALWYFRSLLVCVFLAGVLAIMGFPLLKLIEKINIKKFRIPHGVASFITILVIILVLLGMFSLLTPIIVTQIDTISSIHFDQVGRDLATPISHLEEYIQKLGLIPNDQSLSEFINEQLKNFISFSGLGTLIGTVVSNAGSFFVNLGIVLFLAFFFIKDKQLIKTQIQNLLPQKYATPTISIIEKVKPLLSHYFIGVLLEMIIMMILISTFLWILGVPNALVMGVFGGFMNIIPYLGPFLGTVLSCIFGTLTCLAMPVPDYNGIITMIIKIVITFVGCNMVDNILLQPLIYSKSIKAHPVEIFLVIIMAGSLGGIFAMVLAIPVYTIIRIVAIEIYNTVCKKEDPTGI